MATRPQTIGYALLDSPVALAAWMVDHDTDAYYKIARAFVDGQPSGNLTRDHILDNITLYWLSGTGASAARSYWEAYGPTPRPPAKTPPPARRSRSASRRSRARSGGRRAAGSRPATRTSSTSTRSTRAATSPPGRSRSCSRRRSEQHSVHSVDRHARAARTGRARRSRLYQSPAPAPEPATGGARLDGTARGQPDARTAGLHPVSELQLRRCAAEGEQPGASELGGALCEDPRLVARRSPSYPAARLRGARTQEMAFIAPSPRTETHPSGGRL